MNVIEKLSIPPGRVTPSWAESAAEDPDFQKLMNKAFASIEIIPDPEETYSAYDLRFAEITAIISYLSCRSQKEGEVLNRMVMEVNSFVCGWGVQRTEEASPTTAQNTTCRELEHTVDNALVANGFPTSDITRFCFLLGNRLIGSGKTNYFSLPFLVNQWLYKHHAKMRSTLS